MNRILIILVIASVLSPLSSFAAATTSKVGSITFCTLFYEGNNVISVDSSTTIATSVSLTTAKSTTSTETLISKVFLSSTSTANKQIFGDNLVASCQSISGLLFGNYYYSQVDSTDNVATLYNDQDTVLVSSIADFFPYNKKQNSNSDGFIAVGEKRPDRTMVILSRYTSPVEQFPTTTSSQSRSTAYRAKALTPTASSTVLQSSDSSNQLPVILASSKVNDDQIQTNPNSNKVSNVSQIENSARNKSGEVKSEDKAGQLASVASTDLAWSLFEWLLAVLILIVAAAGISQAFNYIKTMVGSNSTKHHSSR